LGLLKEFPPTAGFPLYLRDFFPAPQTAQALEEDFKNYLNTAYAALTCSGTAAFYFILEALKVLSGKKTVVIPAFVCPLVALAIKRAGLKIAVCDTNPEDFDFDFPQLESLCRGNHDILAIVPVHLGGLPVDVGRIKALAAGQGIFVIEDCAQSLGAELAGKKTGALGDFAFFSLARGKGLTIYEGGAAVTQNKEYARLLDDKIKTLSRRDFFAEALKILELYGCWLVYRPQLFWFAYRLPQIFWRAQKKELKALGEDYAQDFPLQRVCALRRAVGHAQFRRLDSQIEENRKRAFYYLRGLQETAGIKIMREAPSAKSNYPYLVLIFAQREKRKAVWHALGNSGWGISQVYALAITDYPYLRGLFPDANPVNARALAQNSLSLSTSSFLTEQKLQQIINLLKNPA
jgi:dTDP-4-amino-4,6-dideoxygalactose transaminase